MSDAGATAVKLRRSQAVHERAGLASYEPEHDPEGLTVEAAIELAVHHALAVALWWGNGLTWNDDGADRAPPVP